MKKIFRWDPLKYIVTAVFLIGCLLAIYYDDGPNITWKVNLFRYTFISIMVPLISFSVYEGIKETTE